jgi:acetyl-CoA carboxylase biotin carboxyl carrier protein
MSEKNAKDSPTIGFKEFLEIADKYIGKENMCEFSLECGNMKISFASQPKSVYTQNIQATNMGAVAGLATASQQPAEQPSKYNEIKSNMVGTIYTSPSPTEPPYISVGSAVKEGQTIFIIEAMKVMTHFKSPCSGIVKEILVHNEETVEYGKVLARVE